MTNLFWFRRDLRLADNPALESALQAGPVYPVFVIDPILWRPAHRRRQGYLAASLTQLAADIADRGGPPLTVEVGDPATVLPSLMANLAAESVFATTDYGPYGRARDQQVAAVVPLQLSDSPYLHPPGQIVKPDGSPYRVFTPYYKAWRATAVTAASTDPAPWAEVSHTLSGARWQILADTEAPPFPVGEQAALDRLADFVGNRLSDYAERRNFPASHGTSELSAALKYGEVHPRTIAAHTDGHPGAEPFMRQLCWRDFYANIVFDRPDSARANYQSVFDAMPWTTGAAADQSFAAWAAGQTGYPFVDAGMRQLNETGTMPNRLRMVTASFLVKDLAVDWRRGAAYFMRMLYDGDLANNVHGWQWTAGTGTDAAPFYRIFNPVLQGIRFDPEGDYVRRWIPELRGLGGPAVHEPWDQPADLRSGYPDRIVDHKTARAQALAAYEEIKSR